MKATAVQVSSLVKTRPEEICTSREISSKKLMKGEVFSYQITLWTDRKADFEVTFESPISEFIKLYTVKNSYVDFPTYDWGCDDYITKTPCLMPDMLVPLDDERYKLRLVRESASLWVYVRIPEDAVAGDYDVKLSFDGWSEDGSTVRLTKTMTLHISDEVFPENPLKVTQWFHVDCIADVHGVPVYSEEHWALIDKYMALAVSLGINMILTPVITPPLDTKVGTTRPCTQLVSIEKNGENYTFDFTLLKRWVDLCRKNGVKYYEISHLFSQWGIKHSANVKVKIDGEEKYLFGWHTDAQDPEYRRFLEAFLPSLVDFFEKEEIKDRCYFHVSDEPSANSLEAYEYAANLIKPLIGGCQTLDAISDYDFYENGLISTPVVSIAHLEKFIENKVDNKWCYYCCGEAYEVSNRFMAMPSYRTRIIGLQMYKYGLKGFLQWGYNFYYTQLSVKLIDPHVTTSADKAFPSGDAFSVYPYGNGVTPSLRAFVFKEALNDFAVCTALERKIGREAVIKLIDSEAGMNVTFKQYPRCEEYIPNLIEKMQDMLAE